MAFGIHLLCTSLSLSLSLSPVTCDMSSYDFSSGL